MVASAGAAQQILTVLAENDDPLDLKPTQHRGGIAAASRRHRGGIAAASPNGGLLDGATPMGWRNDQ